MTPDNDTLCPCGSGRSYPACCQPWHQGTPAPSPEALMRSRYSAFVQKREAYLLATWHPDTRPANLDLSESPAWASLQVFDSDQAGDTGRVHFRALYRTGAGWGYLEEHSEFRRLDGRWLYLSGTTREGLLKCGRNDPCPCGSGRKYKACCL